MTGIAIKRQDLGAGRVVGAMILVAAGVLAGFGLAQVAPRLGIDTSAQHSGATLALDRAPEYQEYRAGEQGGSAESTTNHDPNLSPAFQAYRAGEQGGSADSLPGSNPAADPGYQTLRGGERHVGNAGP